MNRTSRYNRHVPDHAQFAEPLTPVDRTHVLYRADKVIYFGGCDYLRLSSHPKVLAAIKSGLVRHGLSTSASRMTTGNHYLYEQLERELAKFFESEKALLLPTGYQTNLVVADALRTARPTILIDEKSHASLFDAANLLGGKILNFLHRNPGDLEKKLAGIEGKFVILTDGIFSLSGEVSPLGAYHQLLGNRGTLWVDDSHGAGLFEQGQGTVGYFKLPRDQVIHTVTFSKSFGVFGGAILCSRELHAKLLGSRMVAGSTPLPLPLASGILAALQLIQTGGEWNLLRRNIHRFQKALGIRREIPSPIFSFTVPSPAAVRLQYRLSRAGIYRSRIRYGGPELVFRFALSSRHSAGQINSLAGCLVDFVKVSTSA